MDAILIFILPCIVAAILCMIIFHVIIKKGIQSALKELLKEIQKKINSGSLHTSIQNMKTDILLQFDDFMQSRLTKEMPVLTMFVDDKLIAELKTVFEKELNQILPEVIRKNMVEEKMMEILSSDIVTGVVKKIFQKKLPSFYFTALACACITGLFFYFLFGNLIK